MKTNQLKTPNQSTESPVPTLWPAPDRLGGATVEDRPERALAIQAPSHPSPLVGEGPGERGRREALADIRALSVHDCPNLEMLDLSGVSPGVHVNLRGCLRLRHIRLPSYGAGAVVHLDAGAAAPGLEIDGRIELFDANWNGEEVRVCTPRGRPIDGCHVGAPLADLDDLRGEAAVIFGDAATESRAVPAGSRLRHLEIQAATSLVRLQICSTALRQLVLRDCPQLQHIEAAAGTQRLRAVRCPALSHVDGDGGALTLNGTGAEALTVKGAWNHLNAANLGVRTLAAPSVRELLLRGCEALQAIEVADDTAVSLSGQAAPAGLRIDRLNLDERAVEALLERVSEGDRTAAQTLLDWPESARRPKTRQIAIQGLLGLARLGIDPSEVWRRRCRLHLRNAEPKRQKLTDAEALEHAGRHWRWQFPEDLHQRGWDADLELWLCCRGAAGTEGFEEALRVSGDLTGLATLARALTRRQSDVARRGPRREDAPTTDNHPRGSGRRLPAAVEFPEPRGRRVSAANKLHRLLREAVTRQLAQPDGVRLRQHAAWGPRRLALGTAEMDAVEQLIQVAVALRDRTIADALAVVGEPLSMDQRITVLGSLAAFGHGAARTGLIRLGGELQQPSSRAMARAIDGLTNHERQALRREPGANGLVARPRPPQPES